MIQPLMAKNANTLLVDVRAGPRRDALRPDQAAPEPVQPVEQRRQVHQAGHDHAGRATARRGTARLARVQGLGHRHRHDRGAARQAVPGLQPGRCLDHRATTAAPGSASPSPGTSASMLGGDVDGREHARQGSTFTIMLPAIGPKPRPRPPSALAIEPAAATSGTVLVIDDDQATHDLLERDFADAGLRGPRMPRAAREGLAARARRRGPTRSPSTSSCRTSTAGRCCRRSRTTRSCARSRWCW